MKKVLTIALIGLLASSCSKKPDHSLQDTNSMLEEPKAVEKDSATAKPAEEVVAAKEDSTATKK